MKLKGMFSMIGESDSLFNFSGIMQYMYMMFYDVKNDVLK